MTMLSHYGALGGAPAVYVEDVFSTYLYTGNGSTQTITNGIDLSGKGGLVWTKQRSGGSAGGATNHAVVDTERGAIKNLRTNTTNAEFDASTGVTAFNNNGYSIGAGGPTYNESSGNYTSWTFRKQPKFFDVVTYTGDGTNRTISHNLGAVPGCIIVKRTDTTGDWQVYHRSLANTEYLVLNTTAAKATDTTRWNSTTPTSTVFSLGTNVNVNANGGTYVAYLFAHDAGGFGASGTDNVISCGSYTGSGPASTTVSLGYEPQFLIIKRATGTAMEWVMFDSMRGLTAGPNSNDAVLYPNGSTNENSGFSWLEPTATGFNLNSNNAQVNTSGQTYIYIAIRRGPMKTPTTGTSVFTPTAGSNASSTGYAVTDTNIVDASFSHYRSSSSSWYWADRLRGGSLYVNSASTAAETTGTGFNWGKYQTGIGADSGDYTGLQFFNLRRAPGFFDVVCYTGTGANTTQTHNLGVVPELMIVKSRSASGFWATWATGFSSTQAVYLNDPIGITATSASWNGIPTASVIGVGTDGDTNASASTYVAYLFATVAGVSEVGSYTGNGSSQTINCGFTAGARFVLIKRTDSTGDWYVWDTARGIVANNDPHLSLNTTAAEVTTDDSVDTDNSGFIVNQVSATNINVSSATYIYLAIA